MKRDYRKVENVVHSKKKETGMIFYFSGTGNSKYTAQKLAALTDDKSVNISSIFDNNGFNGQQSSNATTRDVYTSSYDTSLYNKLDDVSTALCNGFNSTNLGIMQGFNSANVLALQNNAAIASAIDNNRFASQQCCCEVKTAIANQDAQNFRNTCAITDTVRAQGDETRALLVQQQIIDLENKLAERDRELQTARLENSQLAQTSAIIQALAPRPIPAYASCSPYQANYYATNGYSCGCGV